MRRRRTLPPDLITEAWRPLVVVDGRVDRRGYTLCVLDRLRLALRRRDVYVVDGNRWGDPRRLLAEPATWKRIGPQVMRTLDLPDRAPSFVDRLGAELAFGGNGHHPMRQHRLAGSRAQHLCVVDAGLKARVDGL